MRMMCAALAVMAGSQAQAQTSSSASILRTADGKPDLQGYWSAESLTPLERPDGFTTLVIPADQADAAVEKMTPKFGDVYDPELEYNFPRTLMQMNGEYRSSLIVEPADGKLPFTALARATIARFNSNFDDPEMRPGPERCVDSFNHPPIRAVGHLVPYQFVQTPDALMIAAEDLDPARIVTIGDPRVPAAVRTRAGIAKGRWEGDTLIVETDHIDVTHPYGVLWRDAALVTEDSRIIERFRPLSADSMLYQFTVEDPSLYSAPWLAEYVFTRNPRPVYEYACHEGNHALTSILLAARMGRQEPPAKPAATPPAN